LGIHQRSGNRNALLREEPGALFFSGLETQGEINLLLDRLSGSYEQALERAVEATDTLVQQTVEHLARYCPLPLLGEAACEELLDLRPHLEEALGALEDLEGRRGLTDKEFAQRRAFKTLLTVRV
jgi:hypothetical protein